MRISQETFKITIYKIFDYPFYVLKTWSVLVLRNFILTRIFRRKILFHYEKYYKSRVIAKVACDSLGQQFMEFQGVIRYCLINNIRLNDITIIVNKKTLTNHTLFRLYERKLTISDDSFFYWLLSFGGRVLYNKGLLIDHKELWDLNDDVLITAKKIPTLEFTADEIKYGNELLKSLGIEEDDKVVPVHYRDSHYYTKRNQDDNRNIYRNSTIDNLTSSIEYLEKEGYKVVLWGNYDQSIEQAYLSAVNMSKNDRDFFDIFIAYRASFCITGNSGPCMIPQLFGVDVIIHNSNWYSINNFVRTGICNTIFVMKNCLYNGAHAGIDKLFSKYYYRIEKRIFKGMLRKRRYIGEDNRLLGIFKKIDNTSTQILSVVKDVVKSGSIQNMSDLTNGKYINAADAFSKINDRPHIRSYNILLLKSQCDST